MLGQRFGMWVVIAVIPKLPKQERRWLCRCDCGTVKSVLQRSLVRDDSHSSRSCGCRRQEVLERAAKLSGAKTKIDLAGQRFGAWVVLDQAPMSRDQQTMWRCRCDCGTE